MNTSITSAAKSIAPGRPANPENKRIFTLPVAALLAQIPVLKKLSKKLPVFMTDAEKRESLTARLSSGEPLNNEFLAGLLAPVSHESISLEKYADKEGDTVELAFTDVREYFLAVAQSVWGKIPGLDPEVVEYREKEAARKAAAGTAPKEDEDEETSATVPADNTASDEDEDEEKDEE